MKPSSALSALAAAATTAAAIVALASPGSAATAPAWTPTQNVSDGFARTVTPGWGSAPQGGVWETKSSSLFSVAAHTGRISVPAPGGTVMQMLNSVSAANELARLSFALPSLPTAANGQYITLRSRVQNDGSALVAQIRIQKTGALSLSLQQLVGTTAIALSTTVAVPYTAAAGEKFDLDLQATGAAPSTAVTARAYPANLTVTPDWQVRGTASARSLAGSLAISLHIDCGDGDRFRGASRRDLGDRLGTVSDRTARGTDAWSDEHRRPRWALT